MSGREYRRAYVAAAVALALGSHGAWGRIVRPRPSEPPSASATAVAPRPTPPGTGGGGAPRGRPAPPAPGTAEGPPRVQVAVQSVRGSRSPEAITRAVHGAELRMARCYSEGLQRNVSLGGLLMLRFTVAPDGTVTPPEVAANFVNESSSGGTVACIVSRLAALHFARTRALAPTDVVVRLRLSPRS